MSAWLTLSKTSTRSSRPAGSARGCGRCPARTPEVPPRPHRVGRRRCSSETWDRLTPIAGEDRVMVVTGRAHRAAVEAQLPGRRGPQRRARERAEGLLGRHRPRRRDPRAPRARRDHRLVRGRPRHRRPARLPPAVARGRRRRRRRATSRRSASCPTEPAIGFGYIQRGDASGSRGRRPRRRRSFVEKPDLDTARGYVEPATTSGTPACSSPAPTCCSTEIGRTKPELLAGLQRARGGLGHPDRGAVVDRGVAGAREDRDRLRGRRARRRGRTARGRPRRLRLGRRRRLRLDREAAVGRPRQRPGRSSATAPASWRTPRAASSSPTATGSSR